MTAEQQLQPVNELVAKSGVRFPNESQEYRRARDRLLAEKMQFKKERNDRGHLRSATCFFAYVITLSKVIGKSRTRVPVA